MPKTLLLADDSVVIQKLVGLSFANEDVKLVTTDNGDDALVRAREIAPDLILADVVMPGKNGYEVCEAIKADPQLSRTPVLLLTGTFEAFDEERARQVGSDGHITKPFEAQGLVDRVTELLAREQPAPVGNAARAAAPAAGATPVEAHEVGASDEVAADDTYDFFDDDVSELAEPIQPSAAADVASDDAFEFGSSEFEPLAGTDEDPLSGESFDETLETGFDLEPAQSTPREDLTIAVSPEAMAEALGRASDTATAAPEPPPLDATVIAEDFGSPPPVPTAETTLDEVDEPADDLFARASIPAAPPAAPAPPMASEAEPVAEVADDAFDFGFEEPAPPMATTVMAAPSLEDLVETPATPVPVETPPAAPPPAVPPPVETPPVIAETPRAEAPLEPEPEAERADWDVSVSDLGQPMSRVAPPSPEAAPVAVAVTSETTRPDLSPMLRDRIHETLEKVAWEAFADLSDTIVRQVLERVESTVWEIVPQMAETLIQEEIRRMKGESE